MTKKYSYLWLFLSFVGCAGANRAPTQGNPTPVPTPVENLPSRPAVDFAEPTVSSARSPGDFRGQVDSNLKRIESNPRDYSAYMKLGQLYVTLNQLKQAQRAFENASLIRPKETEPLRQLALVFSSEQAYEKAIQIYLQLLKADPQNASIKNNLAVAYRQKKDYDSATSLIREALNADKNDIFAINNLGLLYYDTQRYQLAELTFQKAKKMNAETAETYNNLGLTYLAMDLSRNAIAEFQKARELKSDFVAARLNLGNLYLKYSNFPQAMAVYREVLDSDPLNIDANINLGVAYLATGKVSEARQAFATIVEIDPENSKAIYNLALLYHQQLNDAETALKLYQRFVSLERGKIPANHEVYSYISQLQTMAKRPKPAPVQKPNEVKK